jgi:RNA polymerase sigma-70 factor (ECF subfamily)
VNRYSGKITNFVNRQVAHFATAEEIAQDTFLAVYRKRETFKPGHSFSGWLYKIAINFCRMHFRRARRGAPMVSINGSREDGQGGLENVLVDQKEGPHELLTQKEAEERIQEVILTLPSKQRLVFTLSFYDGMSYEEIGRLLGCSPGTVASRKHMAVRKLASRLKKLAPDVQVERWQEGRDDTAIC